VHRALPLVVAIACVPAVLVAGAGADQAGPRVGAAAKHTNVLCLNGAGSAYVVRYRPGNCAVYGPGGSFGGGVNLRRIHWRSWDEPSVRGRARDCGFHLPCADIAVRIRAYRRRHACGRVVFTRLKATSRFGTTIVRLPRCPRAA